MKIQRYDTNWEEECCIDTLGDYVRYDDHKEIIDGIIKRLKELENLAVEDSNDEMNISKVTEGLQYFREDLENDQ